MTQPVMTHDVGSVSAKLAEQGLEADARVLTRLEKRQRSLAELRDFAYTREAADARRAAEDAETRKDLAALADDIVAADPELIDLARREQQVRSDAAGFVATMPAKLQLVDRMRNGGELNELFEEVLLSHHVDWIRAFGLAIDSRYRELKKQDTDDARTFRTRRNAWLKERPTTLQQIRELGERRQNRERKIRDGVRWSATHAGLPPKRAHIVHGPAFDK